MYVAGILMSVICNNFGIQVEYLRIYQTQRCQNTRTLVAAGVASYSLHCTTVLWSL